MTSPWTRRRALALLLPALAACTAQGPRYAPTGNAPAADSGIIYVYRPLGTVATRGEPPFVAVGDKPQVRMRAGSYIAVTVPEGEVEVSVQQSLFLLVPTIPRSVTVTVVAGGRSYVRVDQVISGADMSSGVTVSQSVMIEEVSPEVGQAELEKARRNF
ncbi:MAG: hypothetical protein ACT4SY_11510 [Hyphomicrobiales bacterium]